MDCSPSLGIPDTNRSSGLSSQHLSLALGAEHRVTQIVVSVVVVQLLLAVGVGEGVPDEGEMRELGARYVLPVPQAWWDWPDGGDPGVISRDNSSDHRLSSSGVSPHIGPLLAPAVVPSSVPSSVPPSVPSIVVPKLVPSVIAVPVPGRATVPRDLVEVDQSRHVDPLPHVEDLVRDLVGRDSEEDRSHRDSSVVRLLGGRLLGGGGEWV